MRKSKHQYAVLVALTMLVACRSKEPQLSVFSPKSSAHFVQGDTVHFASELNSELDPGRIAENDWRWVSNVDGEIGRGPRVDATSLTVGTHVVTASVKHVLGTSQDSVTVIVEPRKGTR